MPAGSSVSSAGDVAADEQFLVQLLRRAQAGVGDPIPLGGSSSRTVKP